MAEKKATVKRYRNFATIVYPDSAPENWQGILSDFHVPAFISPLHDRDTLPDGTLKKSHYHVMVMYDNVKTREQMEEIVSAIGGVGLEIVSSICGYARYLCHLDELEKVKYDVNNVRSLSGADYYHITTLPVDRSKCLMEMRNYCRDNHVYSFADLYDYAADNRVDWFNLLNDSCAYVMERYVKGIYFREVKMISPNKAPE